MRVHTTLLQKYTNKSDCVTLMSPKTSVCQGPTDTSHCTCFIAAFNYFLQKTCFACWFLIVTFYWGVVNNFPQTSYRLYFNFLTYFKQHKNGGASMLCYQVPTKMQFLFMDCLTHDRWSSSRRLTPWHHNLTDMSLSAYKPLLLQNMKSLVRLAVISPLHCGSMHKKAGRNSVYCWKHDFF